jgi:hypothetical protein
MARKHNLPPGLFRLMGRIAAVTFLLLLLVYYLLR